jgi:predicted ATP-grasp superfamily ATP-dependent carboligase
MSHATTEALKKPTSSKLNAATVPISRKMNVVVLGHLGRSATNVQRALSAIGVQSYVINDRRSVSFSWSRDAKVLHRVAGDMGPDDDDEIVRKINDAHNRVGIASVIPADVTASLMLARIRDRLEPSTFPIPSIETLQRMDNKWEFAKICMSIGVPIPRTLYFGSNAEIDESINSLMPFPLIVKPASGFGQRGIVLLKNAEDVAAFKALDSHTTGFVIQEFVPGQDWSVSVLAVDGVINNLTAWECPSQFGKTDFGVSRFLITRFAGHEGLHKMVQDVIAATNYSGVANFDARLADDGRMVLFECNPRFFNRMLAARICGLNFVAAGLPGYALSQRQLLCDGSYYPWREAMTLRGWKLLLTGEWPWRYLARDLWEMIRDPLPAVIRKITREDEKAS